MERDPYKYFRIEAREIQEQLGKAILNLEKGVDSPDVVSGLLRLAHTLKGASRVVKQREIADQAHAIEEVLSPLRESSAAAPRECIDRLLEHLDNINKHVAALGRPSGVDDAIPADTGPDEAFRTVRAEITQMDALLDGVTETQAQIGTLRNSFRSIKRARPLLDVLVEHCALRPWDKKGQPPDGVSGDRIRSIVVELGEIFTGLERSVNSSLNQMDRELRQVRDGAEQLRLVPAGALFTSIERAARDTARTLGKRVVFEGRGADVRLDAHVLGAVQGALLQVACNAVAHGIETESGRRLANKPPEGRVTFEVARRGRRIAFRIEDDGQGVDVEAVRSATKRRGLAPRDIHSLGAEDLLRLLLRGGISTSGAVTEISGRGIGLDVVREASERLGGEAIVKTEAGKGTVVEIIVPMSLAAFEALIVKTNGLTATLPLHAVQAIVRVTPKEIARTAGGESIFYDGEFVPFVSLSRMLCGAAAWAGGKAWPAVIVKSAAGIAAVGAEQLLGVANLVLRPLPDLAPADPVVAGVSLDAEGAPQIVLDPDGLVEGARCSRPLEPLPGIARPSVLIVDDSLTTRMLEQSILESAGYQVDVAASGEEAIAKAGRKRYALFLVDIEMPVMDGLTFVERIRADPEAADTPAIMVTSSTSPEHLLRAQQARAQGYIVKSEFDQTDLLDRISRLVG